ncbi:MAG: hypothetical protein QOG23_3868 [Blastocatellia bacterium]|jgi:class 3 adenylate cyclase|nr:hypothetical protein [Blastocatellia bacterium]
MWVKKGRMASQKENHKTLEEWAGSKHLILTLVFTDIVGSTEIGNSLGDTNWIKDLFVHFKRARSLAASYNGYVVKVIGDEVMAAFRTSTDAVRFALAFATETGIDYVGIRVGIHSGEVQIRDNDIYGLNVNFAARVQAKLDSEGILLSNAVKEDYENASEWSADIIFSRVRKKLKSFRGTQLLWRAVTSASNNAAIAQRRKRKNVVVNYW